jgi:hypothetical protein
MELGPRFRGSLTVLPTIQDGEYFERAFVGYKECRHDYIPNITKALVIMNPGKTWHSFEFQLHNSCHLNVYGKRVIMLKVRVHAHLNGLNVGPHSAIWDRPAIL